MSYKNETYKKAENIMQNRRMSSERNLESRKKEVYSKNPRAKEIEYDLSKTASQSIKAIISGKDTKEQLENLKVKNLALQDELKDILNCLNLESDYLDEKYNCAYCKDKGFNDGKMCDCFKKLLRDITYEELNSLSPLSLCSFDKFSLNYYDNEPINGISPKEKMTKIFEYCKSYAYDFNKYSPSLFFQGGTGLGKTHLSLSIANELINNKFGVIYFSVPNLIQKLEHEHFSRDTIEETLKQTLDCDLLILDDLGTEFNTQFSNSAIYNLFNSRLNTHKPTIINTNLTFNEIEKQYSQRFISRLIGYCVKMNFTGKDIRFSKRNT